MRSAAERDRMMMNFPIFQLQCFLLLWRVHTIVPT